MKKSIQHLLKNKVWYLLKRDFDRALTLQRKKEAKNNLSSKSKNLFNFLY
jgi:hypothetical protein